MRVIIDTREQQPLSFSTYENVTLGRDKLECGDYSVAGHDMPGDDHSLIIERKRDGNELVRNLGAEFDRFTNQLELMAKYKHRQIIVCGPANYEYLYNSHFTKLHPNFVYRQIAHIYLKYGVAITHLGCRDSAENYMYRLMTQVVSSARYE